MKVFKKVCAVVMAATMVVSGLGGYEAKNVYAGDSLNDCGDNLYSQVGGGTYTLSIGVKDKDNFSGRNMRNFYFDDDEDYFPWSNERNLIEAIEIGEGVETISANAFSNMSKLHNVTIPESVYYIGKDAFSGSNEIYQITYEGTAMQWNEILEKGEGLGLDLTYTDVRTLAGQGAGYDSESKTIILNVQKPLPEKTYEQVSCFSELGYYTTNVGEYTKCSTGYVNIDATRGGEINERWDKYDAPEWDGCLVEFENNQLYRYRAYIDIKGPNVTDDEITDYMVTTPNVEWKYKRLQYFPLDHVIYFEGFFLNGKDPQPSVNLGEVKFDFSNGNSVIYDGKVASEAKKANQLLISLELFAQAGDFNHSFSDDSSTEISYLKLDLNKDSKYDVELIYSYNESYELEKMIIKKCDESNIKGTFELAMSADTAAFAECIQGNLGYYSKLIFVMTAEEKKDEPKKDDTKKEEVKKDTPKSSVPVVGETIKDSKFSYKVVKAGSADGKTAGEVEITGYENKKASSINIAAEVTINGVKYKVTSIADYAFKNNKKLKKITIGKNIAKIGKGAFFGCTNLKSIKIKTVLLTKKSVGANAFKKINKKATVKVPKKVRKAYKKILKAKGIKGKKQKIK